VGAAGGEDAPVPTTAPAGAPRFAATLRGDEKRLTPLELFFVLVFVLALLVAALCVALVPAALAVPALATLAGLAAVLVALVAFVAARFAELRARLRHRLSEAG
jgi:uncharacterized membrane protein (DUF485 family)